MVAFLVLAALTGGGSRPDIVSLVVLRPVAVIASAAAVWSLTGAQLGRYRFAAAMTGAIIGLTLLHLVPLPPAMWTALPGRAPVVAIDAAAGLGERWRPISLAPADTRNALFSLSVPLAVLLIGAGLSGSAVKRLLVVMIAIGLISGVLGLLQLLGSPTGPLFLYRHTNYGAATGLFANRNHQAIFLTTMFPMLATLASTRAGTPHAVRDIVAALAAGVFLVPLLLVTGSRAGIVLSLLGLASVPLLLRIATNRDRHRSASARRWKYLRSPVILTIAAVMLVVALIGITIGLSRAASVTRLVDVGTAQELRFKVWPVIAAAIPTYLPFGSGIGTFMPVFQMVEPDSILRPTYLNHAHNDVLEVLLTAGVPGAALLVLGIVGWAVAAVRAFRMPLDADGVLYRRLGVVVLALLALGSISDYPLRTPFLAAVAMLAVFWSSGRGAEAAKRPDHAAEPDRSSGMQHA